MHTDTQENIHRDVVVIGGGQAGLAAGYWLRQTGLNFEILEQAAEVGHTWRKRYDSLTLFTSRAYCELPGLTFPGDANGYPGKDEMADYLSAYASQFQLPVRLNASVTGFRARNTGYVLEINKGETVIFARQVIIATGAFQIPKVPLLAHGLSPDIPQFTMDSYRNPNDLPSGTTLVVGDGASGRQIALDIVRHRSVILATGERRHVSPQRVLGKDIFWWLDKTGALWAGPNTLIGKLLRKRNPFPDKKLELNKLQEKGIDVKPRLAGFEGREAKFSNGESVAIDAIVWATGYRDNVSWVKVDGLVTNQGQFKETGLDAAAPGVYFLGRSWQSSRASALVCGVGRDARHVVDAIESEFATRNNIRGYDAGKENEFTLAR